MTIQITNNGELLALKYLIGELTSTERLKIKLFKNDITPDSDSVTGDFTEATFTGYASVLLDTWTITPGTTPEAVHSLISFESTADQTSENIYGYFIVRTSTNDIVGSKRFTGAPYAMQNLGDVIAITPTLKVNDAS